jgi:hypothetical protein
MQRSKTKLGGAIRCGGGEDLMAQHGALGKTYSWPVAPHKFEHFIPFHSISFIFIHCYSLSFIVIPCHPFPCFQFAIILQACAAWNAWTAASSVECLKDV